jgi:hypothetical protein
MYPLVFLARIILWHVCCRAMTSGNAMSNTPEIRKFPNTADPSGFGLRIVEFEAIKLFAFGNP